MNIRKYLRVYKTLISLNLSSLTAYRGGFFAMLLSSAMWALFQYISILLLTSKVKSIYGWTRNELIILTAAYSFFWGIFHIIFARNFTRMSRLIDLAQLDYILVKPIDSQFLLSLWMINFAGLFRTILGGAVLIYMLYISHITVTIINIAGFLVFGFFGLVLVYAFWFITVTLLIWHPRLSNLIDLLYGVTGITRFPPQIVYEVKNFILFFLLPLTFVISTPTKTLLNKVGPSDIIGLLFYALLIFFISRYFWKFALRYYTSANA